MTGLQVKLHSASGLRNADDIYLDVGHREWIDYNWFYLTMGGWVSGWA